MCGHMKENRSEFEGKMPGRYFLSVRFKIKGALDLLSWPLPLKDFDPQERSPVTHCIQIVTLCNKG